jgi:head-tail adaptor
MALVAMDPGQLDRMVSIMRISTQRTPSGSQTESLVSIGTTRAKVEYPAAIGDEQYQADKNTAVALVFFTMRYRVLQYTDQIDYNGRLHDVLAIEEVGRKQYIRIKTRVKS